MHNLGMTAELQKCVLERVRLAKQASTTLARIHTDAKNEALRRMAAALWDHRSLILAENEADVTSALQAQNTASRIDRLALNEQRIEDMINGLHQITHLPDPIGETLERTTLPNGLVVEKCRVPFGVISVIYESRPNVTVDAAGLMLKTSNAVVLRGGKESLRSNQAIVDVLHRGLIKSGIPVDAIQFIDRPEHEAVDILIQARGLIDLAIPRGGPGLIRRVVEGARIPVIETGVGNCHIYVDEEADFDKALQIVLNAKTQRPSVCNAAETLLVHEKLANQWLSTAIPALCESGVEIRGCARTMSIDWQLGTGQPDTGSGARTVRPASEEDFVTEFLAPILAVKVVSNLEEALQHIARYGTKHSEAIVTENIATAEVFLSSVDAAVVYHNASTRFTDGFEFGYGSEIGISTQKLHARGPMGLRELTSYQYRVRGTGQIRS